MKRAYADLHLCIDIKREQGSHVVRKALRLGYGLVAVPLRTFSEDSVRQTKGLCEEAGVDFASRVDLGPRTSDELLVSLRKLRRRVDVVAVLCDSKVVARQAAKDRRVDLLNFPQPDFRRAIFDDAEAELASSCMAALEIDMKPLLMLGGPARTRLLSNLRHEVATAKRHHVPIVISSGVSDEMHVRGPKDLAALASLFDLPSMRALNAVSDNPAAIVNRNREKLGPKFVAPGIRLVQRGENS